jgi:hypothetical protein
MSVLNKSAMSIPPSKIVLEIELVYFISVTLQRWRHVLINFQYFVTEDLTGNGNEASKRSTTSFKKPGVWWKLLIYIPAEEAAAHRAMQITPTAVVICNPEFL